MLTGHNAIITIAGTSYRLMPVDIDQPLINTSKPQSDVKSTRPSLEHLLRTESRKLRDKAHKYEYLADNIYKIQSNEIEELLFDLIIKGN